MSAAENSLTEDQLNRLFFDTFRKLNKDRFREGTKEEDEIQFVYFLSKIIELDSDLIAYVRSFIEIDNNTVSKKGFWLDSDKEKLLLLEHVLANFMDTRYEYYPTSKWVRVDSSESQALISKISSDLNNLYSILVSSNSLGGEQSIINDLQKAQLIALLESMLSALKAPAIETRTTEQFFGWMKKIAKRSVEKKLDSELGEAMDKAIHSGEGLMKHISEKASSLNVDGLL